MAAGISSDSSPPHAEGRTTVVTDDGTTLGVVDRGEGPVLVLVPGWSQTAAEFHKQIGHFARTRRTVAIDHRGHGDSSAPGFGYRLSRLAADLHDVLVAKDLVQVDLLAHSMGCAVVWAYWNIFGGSRIRSVVLVDQPPTMTASPLYGPQHAERLGAPLTPAGVAGFVAALAGPDGPTATRQAVANMFSPSVSPADLAWVLEQNLRTARDVAAPLFLDVALSDWRDIIPRIGVPTLVTGGELSLYPTAGPRWVADQLPDSRLRVFTADELGSHFVFWENPDLFNHTVEGFLDEVSPLGAPA